MAIRASEAFSPPSVLVLLVAVFLVDLDFAASFGLTSQALIEVAL